jgi:hypothetical protein
MDFIRNYSPTWMQDLADALIAMAPRLKPSARVVVIQFPHIVMDIPYSYTPIIGKSVELTNNLRSLGSLIDDSQRTAIEMANAAANRTFVLYFNQSKAIFAGHEPNPARVINRDTWFVETFLTIPVEETYHLNQIGHRELANGLYNFMAPLITPL